MQIGSRLFDGLVNPAPESHLVEFLQAGFVEAFADTIGRWMVGLDPWKILRPLVQLIDAPSC